MGIYHFAPVGVYPGAVTSALAYIKTHREEFPIEGSPLEGLILFVSPNVRSGQDGSPEEMISNEYGSFKGRQHWKKGHPVIDIILNLVQKEMADLMPSGGTICCYVLNPNDYSLSFETVAKATLYFSPPGAVGRQIWANLTGGTNVVNAVLLQVAFLSGLISRAYYTFVAPGYSKYLQPPSRDPAKFRWDDIPLFKTAVDDIYLLLLRSLEGLGEKWYLDEELLSRLKRAAWQHLPPEQVHHVEDMDIEVFRREFLNKLDGQELERQTLPNGTRGRAVRLSPRGRQLLKLIDEPFFQALVARGRGKEEAEGIADFKPEELWRKS